MPKSIQELAGELKDEVLPTSGQVLDDLPHFGGFAPPPQPGRYRFALPKDMSAIYDLFDVPEKKPPQRVRAHFDREHPLMIVQSPKSAMNGEPFETRLTNNERKRGKGGNVLASDFDYLLAAFGYKEKPKSNKEYMQLLSQQGGKQFEAEIRYSWRCDRNRDIRVKDPSGQIQVVEGKPGCGTSYFSEDVSKNPDGTTPYEVECENCKGLMRAFANLDNIRA